MRDASAFLAGGGEMGERIRTFDWSSTPVGPIGSWPRSLEVAVRMMLDSRYPMFIWWGREGLINFYNDAYIPVLGQRHPDALGRPAPDVWADIWPTVGPQAEAVLKEGRATWNEELLLVMERNRFVEETYFTFSYSPVPDDDGGVGGVFCACTEDTERVLGQRRLRTLRALAELGGRAETSEQACRRAARTLADDPHDLPFALLYLLDAEQGRARLVGSAGLGDDGPTAADGGSGAAGEAPPVTSRFAPAAPSVVSLDEAAAPWPLLRVAETGEAVLVDDLERLGALPGGPWPEPSRRAVVLPVSTRGQTPLAGFVVAGLSPRLAFTDDYRAFLDLVAGHVATAIANARALEEERKRVEALAKLDRAKTAFFSNVSHEFRTPLSLMLGPVEDLLARPQGKLTPDVRERLDLVQRNGLRLLRLVNTLLEFSRIEAGRVRAVYEPTELAAFTADLASVFRSACERAGLRLAVDCAPLAEPAFVDREMWEKLVLNLLSNAFKFTFEGEIRVTLRQVGNQVELRVSDTGTGIPDEALPRLFERFYRVENARSRTHEGSGIGLAFVQELAKLHGGSVRAESALGEGTTFVVSLPLGSSHLPPDQVGGRRAPASAVRGASAYVEEALRWLPENGAGDEARSGAEGARAVALLGAHARQEGDAEAQRPRILVADDNADMRQYLAQLLSADYRVSVVPDGEAALAQAREDLPELILADVMMPQLGGLDLLRALRADDDDRLRSVPVILLSARAGEESRVEGMAAGADDYLEKPFSARELLALVSAHLGMSRLRREGSEALRESEQRLRLALRGATAGVWELDVPADRAFWSEELRLLYGVDPHVAPSWGQWSAVVHPEDRDRIRAAFQRRLDSEVVEFSQEFRIVHPERGERWILGMGRIQRDASGRPLRCTGIDLDITDRKRAEEALREADRRKDEFLATLAHELRNPLAPLRSGLQVMELAADDPQTVAQAREMMERQLRQMVRLIDDLLDVSRISRGKISLRKERVELARAVEIALETVRPLVEKAGHELTIGLPEVPLSVEGDETRLAQVFSNLLSNAAKFTAPGGHVTLAVAADAGEAVVRVGDDGVGIPADELGTVFELFSQVDEAPDREQGGLGIGLSLVKRLVEMHGGSVSAHSEGPGRGSEFVVRLPLAAPAPATRPRDGGTAPARSPRRVLVVDDNRDAASSLATVLRMTGDEAREAYDGLDALALASDFEPDVILLDIGMPKLDGYETARRIRALSRGRRPVLVALTGWGNELDRQRSKQAGFDHHLVKPVEIDALRTLLASLGDELG